MAESLGRTLFNQANAVNDRIDEKKIDQLYKLATNKAAHEANAGNYSAKVTINYREYDEDSPYFDFTYDSPRLFDKVIPAVVKRLNEQDIFVTVNRCPDGQIEHWIMTLMFGKDQINKKN